MPKKKKKKSGQPGHALKRGPRLMKAKQWLAAYDGEENRIVRRYRKKFMVDIPTAIRDLTELGHEFPPGYTEAVLRGEEQRLRQKSLNKLGESDMGESYQDDRFYFIAGYTSGGAPYGVTWEQMGLEPYEDEDGIFDEEVND
jgi:hypothetical protein